MLVYMDIIVKCTAATAVRLIDEIRSFIDQEALARRWSFDADATERIGNTISEPYACFLYKDDGNTVVALLALAYTPAGEGYNEGRLWVANVVPRLKDHLEPIEYNRIAQQFAEEILKPVLAQKFMQLTYEMSQPDEKVVSVSVAEEEDENVYDGQFADFKIGVTSTGKGIKYTCDPKSLANLFGANPDAPQYLTPVYFRTAVLDKYINEPSRYDVDSGCLRCKVNGSVLWSIPIDNHGADCVCIWLGDLGKIPFAQQLHFASQNILKGEVSETFFRSQIDAEFCDSTHPVAVFKSSYYKLRTVGWEELGWHLLLPLAEQDQHYMSSLKLLTHNEQKEFDEQVLALTKILIDSLNEKELHRLLPQGRREISWLDKLLKFFFLHFRQSKRLCGISLLDKVFKHRNISDAERHVKFLRNLQELRSTSVAHRKGDKYIKAVRRMGLDRLSLAEVLKSLFVDGINFLRFLTENIDKFK